MNAILFLSHDDVDGILIDFFSLLPQKYAKIWKNVGDFVTQIVKYKRQ